MGRRGRRILGQGGSGMYLRGCGGQDYCWDRDREDWGCSLGNGEDGRGNATRDRQTDTQTDK